MRPHIVPIMTDTQPTGLVGCYPNQDIQSPNLDKAVSIRFSVTLQVAPDEGLMFLNLDFDTGKLTRETVVQYGDD